MNHSRKILGIKINSINFFKNNWKQHIFIRRRIMTKSRTAKDMICSPLKLIPNQYQQQRFVLTKDDYLMPQFEISENDFGYKIIEKMPSYQSTLFDMEKFNLDEKLKNFKPQIQIYFENIYKFIEKPYEELVKSNDLNIYKENLKEVASIIKDISDDELKALICSLDYGNKFRLSRDTEYLGFLKVLDDENYIRHKNGTIDELLVWQDVWRISRRHQQSLYHWGVVKKIFSKVDRLSKEQYIRFMFALNLCRKIPDTIPTFDLEYNLHRHIDKLNVDEIILMAMGFFKTQTGIRDHKLMTHILNKVKQESKTIEGTGLAAISKFAKLSTRSLESDSVISFQEAFIPEIDRLSIVSLTHLTGMGTKCGIINKNIVKPVLQKFSDNFEDTRIKEIERMTLALTMFNIDCDWFYDQCVNNLRLPERFPEIDYFGKSFTSFLHFISIRKIYPYDLLKKLFDPVFLKKHYGKAGYKLQRDLLCLDLSLEIEYPDYDGPRMPDKARNYILKSNNMYLNPEKERVSEYEGNLRKIVSSLEDILGGTKYAFPCNILPQFSSAEIIYCLDNNNSPLPIPNSITSIEAHKIKYIPEEEKNKNNITYYALFMANKSSFIQNSREILGNLVLQKRQIEKLGYTFKMINIPEWVGLNYNLQSQHLKNIIHDENNGLKISNKQSYAK